MANADTGRSAPEPSERVEAAHLVLLGDSIFDNACYVASGRAVIDHLCDQLPAGWRSTLLASDGDFTADVATQFTQLPEGTTHLAISVGGNDALLALSVFSLPVATAGEALGRWHRFAAISSEATGRYSCRRCKANCRSPYARFTTQCQGCNRRLYRAFVIQ